MNEAEFQTFFTKWSKYQYPQFTHNNVGVFELKVVDGNSLAKKKVQDNQIHALYIANTQSMSYKIPDAGIAQKPFDSFMVANVPAYVVCLYNRKARDERAFCLIPISFFLSWEPVSLKLSDCLASSECLCFSLRSEKEIPDLLVQTESLE
jgi:hypothetical protein